MDQRKYWPAASVVDLNCTHEGRRNRPMEEITVT